MGRKPLGCSLYCLIVAPVPEERWREHGSDLPYLEAPHALLCVSAPLHNHALHPALRTWALAHTLDWTVTSVRGSLCMLTGSIPPLGKLTVYCPWISLAVGAGNPAA